MGYPWTVSSLGATETSTGAPDEELHRFHNRQTREFGARRAVVVDGSLGVGWGPPRHGERTPS
jgi:hypothetical protein